MRCYGLYREDFREAISLQSVAALILIYFANITLAFTFGAFLSDNTDNALVSYVALNGLELPIFLSARLPLTSHFHCYSVYH